MRLAFLLVLLLPAAAVAQPADLSRGRDIIAGYFNRQAEQIADACFADLTTKEAWEKRRPERRRQFLEMMGLWPLPPRTDLKATVTGTVDAGTHVIEKMHFQSAPGLYVTANLYRPTTAGKHPAVLYVCGHGNVVEGGVSYGSKVSYQYHPAWFAAHGYVCLVLDTLQLSEIPALHHGTYREKMWWWQTRGYTPAGIELWNAMRAIDYLESRPEVDADKIGLTGRSGGGATSWWTAAADERIKAVVPVAGIADLHAQISEGLVPRLRAGVIAGHCDCMFPVNTHRWEFAQVAALIAPRPLLLGNSDADDIFPVPGYRRLADRVRKVYALYGAEEKFQLLETKGPHKDTPELRAGVNRWLNRWVKGDTTTEVSDDLPPKRTPRELKVLTKTPDDQINTTVHETWIKPAAHPIPDDPAGAKEWWANRRGPLLDELRAKVFAGWPTDPPAPAPVLACDTAVGGERFRAIDFTSEAGVPLRLFVRTAADGVPAKVVLSVLDEQAWTEWLTETDPAHHPHLRHPGPMPAADEKALARVRNTMRAEKVAFAAIAPRGVGPTRWADAGSGDDTHIRRRFPLLGQTLDGQRVWDVRRAVSVVRGLPDLAAVPLRLHGDREAGTLGLYAGLFEPTVAEFDLWHPPASHRVGPIFLNVATVLDVPQAAALAAPRPVTVWVRTAADRAGWEWAETLHRRTAGGRLTVAVGE